MGYLSCVMAVHRYIGYVKVLRVDRACIENLYWVATLKAAGASMGSGLYMLNLERPDQAP